MAERGGLLLLSGRVRGFTDNLTYHLRDHETIPDFIERMYYLIDFLSYYGAEPLTAEEAAYIVVANLPYEEPWLPIHDNFLGEFEYPSEGALMRLTYQPADFWSLDDLEAILIYHYIRWRNDMIVRGVPRAEVLRYGEIELPEPPMEIEIPELPIKEEPPELPTIREEEIPAALAMPEPLREEDVQWIEEEQREEADLFGDASTIEAIVDEVIRAADAELLARMQEMINTRRST